MSRRLRSELRSIRSSLTDSTSLSDGDRESVREGLTAEDTSTQRQAVRTLKKGSPETAADFFPELQAILEQAVDTDDDDIHEASETAARTILSLPEISDSDFETLEPVAEDLLDAGGPQRATAGAVLIVELSLNADYTPTRKQVNDITTHILLTTAVVNNVPRKIDYIAPSLGLLAFAAREDAEYVVEQMPELPLEQYLKSPYQKARAPATHLLQELAADCPDYVSAHNLDLVTQLRDDEENVVALAGRTLETLAESAGIDQLRPVTQLDRSDFERESPSALTGLTKAVDTIAEAAPPWLEEIPINSIVDLQRNDAATKPTNRARTVAIVGKYAATADSSYATADLVQYAYATLETADDPIESIAILSNLKEGLSASIEARPAEMLSAVTAAGNDLGGPVEDTYDPATVLKAAGQGAEHVSADGGMLTDSEHGQDTVEFLSQYVTIEAIRHALQRDRATRDRVLDTLEAMESPEFCHRVYVYAISMADFSELPDETRTRVEVLEARFRDTDHFGFVDEDTVFVDTD